MPMEGTIIVWKFVDGELFVSIDKSKAAPVATIDLNFFGASHELSDENLITNLGYGSVKCPYKGMSES